jgi:hypothetical protein
MAGYPLSFLDWLRPMSMSAIGAQQPMGTGFQPVMPSADQMPMMDPAYQPTSWASGSPAGDDGGIMGGGDSLAKDAAGGWTKDQMSGGMMAARGLGQAVNALTGGDQRPIQAPRIDDNSAQIRQQAAQMWQQMMQKKQPRGLI